MNIGKLPINALVAILFAILIGLLGIGLVSHNREEPFMIYGKEFGFGSEAYKKANKELSAYQDRNQRLEETISGLIKEKLILQEELSNLKSKLDAETLSRNETWFPLDELDITSTDKGFRFKSLKSKGSTWKSPDEDFSLQIIRISSDEILLETNLEQPYNQLRLNATSSWTITTSKWKYRISLNHANYYSASMNIERRSPTK